MKKYAFSILCLTICFAVLLAGCGSGESSGTTGKTKEDQSSSIFDPMKNKGIGPITSIVLADEIDQEMADKGKEVYELMCTACHKTEAKFIGPAPKGILERRSPEWVMNMILNPEEMVQKDPMAKALFIEYNGSPMANQNLTEEEARAVLEYFRTL
jgi:mono/diheme cytochrome c family protein